MRHILPYNFIKHIKKRTHADPDLQSGSAWVLSEVYYVKKKSASLEALPEYFEMSVGMFDT